MLFSALNPLNLKSFTNTLYLKCWCFLFHSDSEKSCKARHFRQTQITLSCWYGEAIKIRCYFIWCVVYTVQRSVKTEICIKYAPTNVILPVRCACDVFMYKHLCCIRAEKIMLQHHRHIHTHELREQDELNTGKKNICTYHIKSDLVLAKKKLLVSLRKFDEL